MSDYQNRVIAEKAELDERKAKLEEFMLTNELFKSLGEEIQGLMKEQLFLMIQLSNVLGKRIAAF